MSARVKLRQSIGANPARTVPATWLTGGWQAYEGPGLLRAMVIDVSSTSGLVLTAYDNVKQATTGPSVWTMTGDVDIGTTVPATCYTDGDLPAGTSTANVKAGIPFANGLYVDKTGDSTHDVAVSMFITPLIKKSVNVAYLSGAAGSGIGAASVFDGPGILHGYRIRSNTLTPSTTDFLLKDSPRVSPTAGTGSGNTIMTKTNYGYAAEAVRPCVTLTSMDETGAAVTTAATGAYASPGLFFATGLNVSVQQAQGVEAAIYQFDFLIEA